MLLTGQTGKVHFCDFQITIETPVQVSIAGFRRARDVDKESFCYSGELKMLVTRGTWLPSPKKLAVG